MADRTSRQGGKRLADVLSAEPRLAGWMARAQRDAGITTIVAHRVPAGLAGSFRVLSLEHGELLLAATNGAAAIALRREAPTLLTALRARALDVESVRAVVVPRSASPRAPAGARRRIDARGVAALEALARRLPEGPLREAVGRLASDHQQQALEQEKDQDPS